MLIKIKDSWVKDIWKKNQTNRIELRFQPDEHVDTPRKNNCTGTGQNLNSQLYSTHYLIIFSDHFLKNDLSFIHSANEMFFSTLAGLELVWKGLKNVQPKWNRQQAVSWLPNLALVSCSHFWLWLESKGAALFFSRCGCHTCVRSTRMKSKVRGVPRLG